MISFTSNRVRYFVVMGHRSAASVMGPASRPVKGEDGNVRRFATEAEAQAYATDLNATVAGPNVRYTVEAR